MESSAGDAVARLDELTRKLRRECPWDREQDERSIVPHTVGEAYELAAAAHERRRRQAARRARRRALPGALPVAAARGARHGVAGRRWPSTCTPSSCAGTRTSSARSRSTAPGEVLRTGTRSRRARTGREPGIFGDVPENLPGPLYALKTQRRAASTGFDFDHVPYEGVTRRAGGARGGARRARSASTRSATCCSRRSTSRASSRSTRSWRCGPSAERFQERVEAAEELAQRDGARVGRARHRGATRLLRPGAYRCSAEYEPDRIRPRTPDP